MSRIVEHNETFTGIPTSYSASSSSYITNPTNAYASSANTSNYATLRSNRNAQYSNFYFNVNGIPQNSDIDTVTCAFRVRLTNAGYTGNVQLYGANGAKGSVVEISTTTNSVRTITTQDFSFSDLSSVYLRFSHVVVNGNRYIYFYGATLAIDYTWYETFYSISTSSNVQGVSISSTSGETLEGGSNTITLSNVSDISTIKVMDNGNDITSLFTRSGSNYTYTLTNINADHTIVVEDNSSSSKKSYVKKNNAFVESTNQYVKESNSWINRTISKIFWKINGSWADTNDSMSGKTAFKIE